MSWAETDPPLRRSPETTTIMSHVNPEILAWARQTAGLSLEQAAAKIELTSTKNATGADRLAALEAGQWNPTRPLLLRMAKQYQRPLLAFYLSKPPAPGDRGTDFRTLPETASPRESAIVDALLRDVAARQRLVREAMETEDEIEPVAHIGSVTMSDGVHAAVASMRQALGLDLTTLRVQSGYEAAFAVLRERVESLGIFVLLIGNLGSHHSAISVQQFRGFAIADRIAPFIVINDQDAKPAWSFSLIHELTHLWLGQTGVSGTDTEANVERFCNDVASEFLLPAEELNGFDLPRGETLTTRVERIVEFAHDRNLSAAMVAYKLFRAGRIAEAQWREINGTLWARWIDFKTQSREQARTREGGADYYIVRRHRLGPTLIRTVARMLGNTTITTTKAATILGVKPQAVPRLLGEAVRMAAQRAT